MLIYLDNAATTYPKPSFMSSSMINAMLMAGANPGRSGHKLSVAAARLVYSAREELNKLLNGDDPLSFSFTLNCTAALNTAIKGLLKQGDHVVTTMYEHNSVLRPLEYLKDINKITYTLLVPDSNGQITPQAVKGAIKPNTRLVIVNHVSNVTGHVMDIKGIGQVCKQHKVIFLVDAAQSAGSQPIDIQAQNIDILCASGHKGLYGPQGTGVLYVKQGVNVEPLCHGGTGSNSESLKQPSASPDKFESGTLASCNIAGLGASVAYVNEKREEIYQHELFLAQTLLDELRQIKNITVYSPLTARSGVVSFNIAGFDSAAVANILDEKYNIACRAGLHCAPLIHKHLGTLNTGAVRLSIGMYNNIREIFTAIRAINEIAKMH